MKAVLGLLAKELREETTYAAGLFAIISVVCLLSAVAVGGGGQDARTYPYQYLPLMLLPFCAAGLGARRFSWEYTSGAGLLLSSAPMARWAVWLTKALAGYVLYVVSCALPVALRVGPALTWGGGDGPTVAVAPTSILASGLATYLLALVISSLGRPGRTAALLALLLGMASSLVLVGERALSGVAAVGGWLSLEPGPTVLYARQALSALLPVALTITGLVAYGRCAPGEPARQWSRATGLLAGVIALCLLVSVGIGLARSRVTTPLPAGEIQDAACTRDAGRLVFRAQTGGYGGGALAWWELRPSGPKYLTDSFWGVSRQERLGGYLVLTGGLPPSSPGAIWLLREGGERAYVANVPPRDMGAFMPTPEMVPSADGTVVALNSRSLAETMLEFCAAPGVWTPEELLEAGDSFIGWGDTGATAYVLRLGGSAGHYRSRIMRLAKGERTSVVASPEGRYVPAATAVGEWAVLKPAARSFFGRDAEDGYAVNLETGAQVLLPDLGMATACSYSTGGALFAAAYPLHATRNPAMRVYDLRTGRVLLDSTRPWRKLQLYSPAVAADYSRLGRSSAHQYGTPMWSPDGRRVAMQIEEEGGRATVAVYDLRAEDYPAEPTIVDGPQRTLSGWWADARLVVVTLQASHTVMPGNFEARRATRPRPTAEVALVDPDTGTLQPILETQAM